MVKTIDPEETILGGKAPGISFPTYFHIARLLWSFAPPFLLIIWAVLKVGNIKSFLNFGGFSFWKKFYLFSRDFLTIFTKPSLGSCDFPGVMWFPWGHVISRTKFEPDRFSCLLNTNGQTNTQTPRQATYIDAWKQYWILLVHVYV